MYEKFTDRARKVMQLANQEAQRFNHEYVGTEHILLGLAKENQGVAQAVLKNLGTDLCKIRAEVEKLVRPGPDLVTLGRLPQTPRAKKVVAYSIEEAEKPGHSHVGTEHLLLGCIREDEGIAAQVLAHLGLKLEDVRKETLILVGQPAEMQRRTEIFSFTIVRQEANLDRACDSAYQKAVRDCGADPEVEFLGYNRRGDSHHYTFRATVQNPLID